MKRSVSGHAGLIILMAFYSGCSSSPPNQDRVQGQPEPSSIISERDTPTLKIKKAETAESSLIMEANSSTRQQNYSKAIVVLERAIRLSPREPSLWIRLSEGYLKKEDLNLAEQYARKAINLARNNSEVLRAAWLQLANVLEKMGNVKKANELRKKYRYRAS